MEKQNLMSIKEAGRYANFLENLKDSLIHLANEGIPSKIFKTKETHYKSKANKEAEDETIEMELEDNIDVELIDLTNLIGKVVVEKIALSNAISKAKASVSVEVSEGHLISIESSYEYAKLLREVSRNQLSRLINNKDSKNKTMTRGYAFNVEGNQTSYYYEVETEKTLQYEKDEYIKMNKDMNMLADSLSKQIDAIESSNIVEFSPTYNYLDSMEDIINEDKLLS